MPGRDVRLENRDGGFGAYLASPASGHGPGIVVIQEIFGVNKVMRDIADGLAAQGYFALVPDLFWRLEPGIQLTDKTKGEWDKALGLMGRFNADSGVSDIQTGIDYLRTTDGCSGKVGAVGYCLGGLLAFLTAARSNADAVIGYYGVNIQDHLAEAAKIKKPLMLHMGGADQYVPPPAQEKIVAGLMDNPLVTLHRYPGMDHAFAREGGEHYDKPSADLANGRSAEFFRRNLG